MSNILRWKRSMKVLEDFLVFGTCIELGLRSDLPADSTSPYKSRLVDLRVCNWDCKRREARNHLRQPNRPQQPTRFRL